MLTCPSLTPVRLHSHLMASITLSGSGALLRALAAPNFRNFAIGSGCSMIGTWTQKLAVGWLTWKLTESGTWLGVISFADILPGVALLPLTGAVADRVDRAIDDVHTAIRDIRNFISGLVPLDLGAGGLAGALARLGEEVARTSGLLVEVDAPAALALLSRRRAGVTFMPVPSRLTPRRRGDVLSCFHRHCAPSIRMEGQVLSA